MGRITLQDERGFNQVFASVGTTPLRARRRTAWFASVMARIGAQRVLEIGCGTGENAAHLAGATDVEIVAVDISPAFIATARERHRAANLRFELLDLLGDSPHALGQFDFVCGNGILHHLVRRLPEVLRALHGLATPGGGLAFIEPNLLNPYCAAIFGTAIGRRLARLEPEEMAFTPGQLRRALAEAGWRRVEVTTRDFLLPGLPERLARPIVAVEPALEATVLTRWLAQSNFATALA